MRIEELERGGGGARGQVVHAHGELLQVRHAGVHLHHQRRQRARTLAHQEDLLPPVYVTVGIIKYYSNCLKKSKIEHAGFCATADDIPIIYIQHHYSINIKELYYILISKTTSK